ncbi:sugar ABC transporter ATP-binding protein [Kaistia algarum]|uniref:sugar ABC transporter ATP-binding protein n=1 Tax=Kaistia algarum TaxID=2083279 RepID=UPI000CE757B3|nr:sugar ABC transporter ATP-binding protein [Kaistia algarum]MCX5513490.1 sugar ABC transporter ATP-binding protein [Kaistia algarum]PPE78120.1 sugar ABC transporter ATP-binding protein [Kaistia algarum]
MTFGGAPFLALSGLTKRFGATLALDRAELALRPGSVHALLGENGAGKSTLIKILSGVYRPDEGAIRLDGAETAVASPRAAEALGFRFIHQELNLVPHFDAVANAWIGRRHPRRGPLLDNRAMRERVEAVAARIAPDLPLSRPAARLTPGQRQMAEIVRALMEPARLVVMDEPTSSLSEGEAERLHAVVRQLAAEGTAVLFISHRLDEVIELCGDYTVLRNGRTVGSGAMASMDRAGLVALMSGATRGHVGVDEARGQPSPPLWGKAGEGGADSVSPENGNSTAPDAPNPAPALPPPSLPHKGGGIRPPDSVSPVGPAPVLTAEIAFGSGRLTLEAFPGEIVGLYGLVGSGRSSLLKVLWGATRTPGTIRVDGRKLVGGPADRIRNGIAYVPEDRRREGFAAALSIEANLALPHLPDFRAAPALPIPSRPHIRRFATDVGRRIRLAAASLAASPLTLSGGNQQKLLFGRWLGRRTRVMLVDEPTRGVDVGAKAEIHAEMRRIAADGAAVIMATSDMEELMSLSTRILVLHQGSVIAELAAEPFDRSAIVAAAFGHSSTETVPSEAA